MIFVFYKLSKNDFLDFFKKSVTIVKTFLSTYVAKFVCIGNHRLIPSN